MGLKRVFSNGPSRDFVINPFKRLMHQSSRVFLAAPYFTSSDPVREAAAAGKLVQVIVGLNASTSPQALAKIHGVANLRVRFLTHRFHAKIYIFDDTALVGSSNLTDGGLLSNREATLCLDQPNDAEAVEELRALFLELWDSAQVLTREKLDAFVQAHKEVRPKGPDPDALIERAVGRAEPLNINVASRAKSPERLFLEQLRQQVYEQYRPAFEEVQKILLEHSFRRPELANIGTANETNRFLNWVRLSYVPGDEAWQSAPLRSPDDRRNLILQLGSEWARTDNSRVPEDYVAWLHNVERVFESTKSVNAASKDELTQGLMSLHAFFEMLRFVKGGAKNLPAEFWRNNDDDVSKVKASLLYLLHGSGDFIQRLHDMLYDPDRKLAYFGRFCALELYGTIKPAECPPLNGRMAKALRFLGFDVRGT